MNYQELLLGDELLAQTVFQTYAKAICIYSEGDIVAKELCDKVNKRWNQYTKYISIKGKLSETLSEIVTEEENSAPYSDLGFRQRIYFLYITSSLELIDIENDRLGQAEKFRVDELHVINSGDRIKVERPKADRIRLRWLVDSNNCINQYVVIFLLICEIYNDKGAYTFIEHITGQSQQRDSFKITADIYDAEAQKKALHAKNALSHALGASLLRKESISMVEKVFRNQFRCEEEMIRYICGQCPNVEDLLISFSGYENLSSYIKNLKDGMEISYQKVVISLYGSGEEKMDSPIELLYEAEKIVDKFCRECLEKKYRNKIFHYPLRFLIKEGSQIIEKERAEARKKYAKCQEAFKNMIEKEGISLHGKWENFIDRACENLNNEFCKCIQMYVCIKWWEELKRIVQNIFWEKQEDYGELQGCYNFLRDYIIGEEPEVHLDEQQFLEIDWERPVNAYFDIEKQYFYECDEKDLYRFYNGMNWKLQDVRSRNIEGISQYFYCADRTLEEEFYNQYGREGSFDDLIFLDGIGKKHIYLLRLQRQGGEAGRWP